MNKVCLNHGVKIPVFRVFSGFYFIVFGLNKKIYSLNLHTKAKYGNIWTRTNSEYIPFSYSEVVGNKTKGTISKRVLQENKAHQIF